MASTNVSASGNDWAMDLNDIADELYGLSVEQFTEARNARAKELSASGDKNTAAEVRKLRKPSHVAWLANTLARRHPKEVDEVLDLGRELRQAQDQGRGADLRKLSTARQDLLRRVLRSASDEANAVGVSFSSDAQRQLLATLEAAMASESSGLALKTGRLAEALSHVGFGGAEPSDSTRRGRPKGSDSHTVVRRDALDEAERAVTDAQGALDVAEAALNQARQRHESAKVRQREVTDELRKVEREMKESAGELEEATARQKRESASLLSAERERQRRAAAVSR